MATRKTGTKNAPKTLDKALDEVQRVSKPRARPKAADATPTASKGLGPKEAPSKDDKATDGDSGGEGLVVFAFRLTAAEREQIHQAAGRGKASWFVKTLAIAVAQGDAAAFNDAVQAVGLKDV